ncbi:MAG: hypothetical protein IPI64_06335 [Chloracidobacterium sp.]|nr:hypothetical protein [Chloracidobacterium sp.]
MSIIPKLATSLNRRDEVPNVELAASIVARESKMQVSELLYGLSHRNKGIRHDCIKVLYEIGKLRPRLIAEHYRLFVAILGNADNRLQWGAMTALSTIVAERPREIYISLKEIVNAADKGSVITRDQCVKILIALSATEKYAAKTFPLLLEQLTVCPTNQLPMYAENSIPAVNITNRDRFVELLTARLGDLEKENAKKRVSKVINRVSK